jgi:hypothetical protein
MPELRVGDQLVRFDLDSTVTAYLGTSRGDADRCSCQGCRNFALQRNAIYPDGFRDILGRLGVDWHKEGEAVHYGPKASGHLYGGWFYFTGELIEKGESCIRSGEEFQYWIGTSFPRPPDVFRRPVVAVEFLAVLPWSLGEAYDPKAGRQMSKAKEIIRRYSGALEKLAKPSS